MIRLLTAIGALLMPGLCLAAAGQTAIAVAEFDYSDGSGEARDQSAAHAERLQRFSQDLRADLAKNGNFRVIALDCADFCTANQANLNHLTKQARQQGARLLVFGLIHKQSTLIQWSKTELLDLATDQILLDKLLSFRGDDDSSWRHAESFLAKDILAAPGAVTRN
jgi:hypothetical protein